MLAEVTICFEYMYYVHIHAVCYLHYSTGEEGVGTDANAWTDEQSTHTENTVGI